MLALGLFARAAEVKLLCYRCPLHPSSFLPASELLAAIADRAGFTPRRSEREHGELAKEWRSPGRYFSVGSKQAYREGTQLTALFSSPLVVVLRLRSPHGDMKISDPVIDLRTDRLTKIARFLRGSAGLNPG